MQVVIHTSIAIADAIAAIKTTCGWFTFQIFCKGRVQASPMIAGNVLEVLVDLGYILIRLQLLQ